MARVAVFGLGYVGCVTAACLARDGHTVIGVDVDSAKVARVNAGDPPVSEPGLEELLQKVTRSGALKATTSMPEALAQTDIALVAVGTPSTETGNVNTVAVEQVMQQIGAALADRTGDYTVVVRSTLLPGILEDRLEPALRGALPATARVRVSVCNNPEFLRESTAIRDYDEPPYILVGTIDPPIAERVFDLYSKIPAERLVVGTRSAAMIKYVCNAFHATKVAFANEIGVLAKSLGAYMRPGFAFGGSCLPKDLRALIRHAEEQSLQISLLPGVLSSNETHLRRAVKLVEQSGRRRVGLVGLSFKADTDDLRESPLVMLAEILLGKGYELQIHDPGIELTRLHGRNLAYVDRHLPHLARLLCADPVQLRSHSELLLLGTDVADRLDPQLLSGLPVIDLRKDLGRP
jgi:GDP-mannose 6-dehydrogenase